jgi:hypothetical protein
MPASNGGTAAPLNLVLFPMTLAGATGNGLWTFDPTNFNDPNSPSSYAYKQEDVICGRNPTINRIYISHRDLGQTKITVTITGNNDKGKVVSKSVTVNLGTADASNRIITTVYDQIAFTGQNLQISWVRAAGAGPVAITKFRAEGGVEK